MHLLVIHSWLPREPGSGIAKAADGSAPWDFGSNWRLRSARGILSVIGSQLKLHTTISLLCKGLVFRNTACSLPLAEQLLLVTWTTQTNVICLLAACSVGKQSMFPVLTRSGSLVPYFPYTAYVKLRTRKQDGLVLFYGLLLTRQREHATSETPRSFPLLPREPGWAPLSFGEYPREHNQAKQVRV